jgi:hypothetical protein
MRRRGNDTDEILLEPNDVPSEENPSRSYRWRGKETCEGVIELMSESKLYKMTFSDGRRKISGTWGVRGDPGEVTFKGVKIQNGSAYLECNIGYEWDNHFEAAYDKADRDRWRNRY